MTMKGKAYIAGSSSITARAGQDGGATPRRGGAGALAMRVDRDDVDGYFCAADAPGPGAATMAEDMNLKLRHVKSPKWAARPYVALANAAEAIALGNCSVALITLAGRPRSEGHRDRHDAAAARSEPTRGAWSSPMG